MINVIEKVDILGIHVNKLTYKSALEIISSYLQTNKNYYIVTPNPEIILEAQKNQELRKILNNANLSLPDGFGLILASKLKIINRVTGIDILINILQKFKKCSFAFIIKRDGLSNKEEVVKMLKVDFNLVNYQVFYDDERINYESLYDFVFVGLGCPEQELWIEKNMNSNAKIYLTVGGSIDFLTKKQKRAPVFFRRIGIEWLWRLINQPSRYRRIFNATFKFLWAIIFKSRVINYE